MASPITRSSAARTALLAQGALAVCALGGAAAVLTFPSIKDPQVAEPTDIGVPAEQGPRLALAPPDTGVISRFLTTAANFPPPPRQPESQNNTNGGSRGTPGPSASSGPEVRFLGAIVEPDQYVALLSIDGRQKFLRVGDSFSAAGGVVRLLECSAGQAEVEVGGAGRTGARRTLALAQREGNAWTEPTFVPSSELPAAPAQPSPDQTTVPPYPGLPPGVTIPAGMTPQQIEEMRRTIERAQRESGGDGSQ